MYFFGNKCDNFPILTDTAMGASVTPGASGAWGSWTQLIAGASNVRGGVWHRTNIHSNYQSGVDRRLLVDLGIRPAGASGSEMTIVPRLVGSKACDAAAYNPSGLQYEGPIQIPAGYDIVCRAMSNQASPVAVRVFTEILADPLYEIPQGSACEVLNVVDANVQGNDVVAFSNSTHVTAGYGTTWTAVGTITHESKWLDAAVTKYGTDGGTQFMAARFGFGSATTPTVVITDGTWGYSTGIMFPKKPFSRIRNRIPAGSTIYAQVVSQSAVTVAVAVWNYY